MNKYQLQILSDNNYKAYYLDNELIISQAALDFINSYDYMPLARLDYHQRLDKLYDEYVGYGLYFWGVPNLIKDESRYIRLITAQAYLANMANSAQTQFIESEATTHSLTPTQFAETVLSQFEQYMSYIATADGYRVPARVAIDAATTIEQLEAAIFPIWETLYGG